MKLTSDQIRAWSEAPDITRSMNTYHALKGLIEDRASSCNPHVYLQGSYANHTNIEGRSDIDIVVVMVDSYPLEAERDRLMKMINGANGFKFSLGSKTVKYSGTGQYVDADLVPCKPYFSGSNGPIYLYDHKRHVAIRSNPIEHIYLCDQKNKLTNGNFKSVVRIFKNARSRLFNHRYSEISSHAIESVLLNIDDIVYRGNIQDVYQRVLSNVSLRCYAGMLNYTRDSSNGHLFSDQNEINDFMAFISALCKDD